MDGSNHHGYFNLFVRGSNAGLALYYGRQSDPDVANIDVWFNNMPVQDNVWRYNFFGDDVRSWMRIKSGNVPDEYAPSGNVVTDNIIRSA